MPFFVRLILFLLYNLFVSIGYAQDYLQEQTFCASPVAAAFTSSSFKSPDTCASNIFFSKALSRSEEKKNDFHCLENKDMIRIQKLSRIVSESLLHSNQSKENTKNQNFDNIYLQNSHLFSVF